MRFTIQKTLNISCAHQLMNMPANHQCGRLHGHNYQITVNLSARTLDEKGFVCDFGAVSSWIKDKFDHQNLNDFFAPTTAEVFAKIVWDGIELDVLGPLNKGLAPKDMIQIDSVSIEETPTCKATLIR